MPYLSLGFNQGDADIASNDASNQLDDALARGENDGQAVIGVEPQNTATDEAGSSNNDVLTENESDHIKVEKVDPSDEVKPSFDPTQSSDLLVRIKKENEGLRASIKKLNFRLGDETVSDDDEGESAISSNNEDEPMRRNSINTINYQIDRQFVPDFFFITNVSN